MESPLSALRNQQTGRLSSSHTVYNFGWQAFSVWLFWPTSWATWSIRIVHIHVCFGRLFNSFSSTRKPWNCDVGGHFVMASEYTTCSSAHLIRRVSMFWITCVSDSLNTFSFVTQSVYLIFQILFTQVVGKQRFVHYPDLTGVESCRKDQRP